jgi:hypothetical protein
MKECSHLIIFTNDIEIDNQIEASAMIIIFSMSRMFSIMMNKKQAYVRLIIEITIYSEEIMKLDLVLNDDSSENEQASLRNSETF